jgi:hypothetical protein
MTQFKTAEDRVDEDAFEAVLTVLAGKSPWQDYIGPALDETRKNLAKHPFRILPEAEYKVELAKIDKKADPATTPGITSKQEGFILLEGYFGTKSRETRLGLALHETVHLISHRPGRAGRPHSTAFPVLGEGLLEGLVELITTDILNEQKIKLADPKGRGHQARVPVVEALLSGTSIPLLARVLFEGEFGLFFEVMNSTYSGPGWIEIQRLTTADDTAGAIRRMKELGEAEEKRHNERLKQLIQQIPQPTASQQTRAGTGTGFIWHKGMSPPPPVRY